MNITDYAVRMFGQNFISGCMNQVRLTKTSATVYEKRVISATRIEGNLLRGRPGKIIGFTHN